MYGEDMAFGEGALLRRVAMAIRSPYPYDAQCTDKICGESSDEDEEQLIKKMSMIMLSVLQCISMLESHGSEIAAVEAAAISVSGYV